MPSKESIRVDNGVNAFCETVDNGVNAFPGKDTRRKHARVPWVVGSDIRLTDRDVRVYFALASFTRTGPRASAGIRWISKCIHAPARSVIQSLRRLAEHEHIEIIDSTAGRRREYRLLSPIFEASGQRQASVDTPEKARMIVCGRCTRPVGGVSNRTGWCKDCAKKARMEQQYRGAQTILGLDATFEQVVKYLDVEKSKRTWREIARRVGAAA